MVAIDATKLQDNEVPDSSVEQAIVDSYHQIAELIVNDPAIQELDKFGTLIKQKPLDLKGRQFFFGTLWPFFREVSCGILVLSARVTDELLRTNHWEAQTMAAYILYATIDEYGLDQHAKHFLPPHHVLFKRLTEHVGLSADDLQADRLADPSGISMGHLTMLYYRHLTMGQALGFHLASEMVSSREFLYFLEGFQAHADYYGLKDRRDPVLSFFQVHANVEPMHVSTCKEGIIYFLRKYEGMLPDMQDGAKAFMRGFEAMFKAINHHLETAAS